METVANSKRTLTSLPKDYSTPKMTVDGPQRKTLQTLQPSACGDSLNGGKTCPTKAAEVKLKIRLYHEDANLVKTMRTSEQAVKVYEDPVGSSGMGLSRCSRMTQTDDSWLPDVSRQHFEQAVNDSEDSGRESGYIDPEAYDLLVSEEVSDNYWKELAEERRRALRETLIENEKLMIENDRLKLENSQLAEFADKAKALQKLLQGVLAEGETQQDDDEDDAECSSFIQKQA